VVRSEPRLTAGVPVQIASVRLRGWCGAATKAFYEGDGTQD